MSKEEIYIRQGKARDELKTLKSYVATLTASLRSTGASVKELGEILEALPGDFGSSVERDTLRETGLKGQLRRLEPESIVAEVEELFFSIHKMQSLQKQVDEF